MKMKRHVNPDGSMVKVPASTVIGNNVGIGIDVRIADGVFLGYRSRIGNRVTIGGGVCLGYDVCIGDNARIGKDVRIGNCIRIRKGAVIDRDVMLKAFETRNGEYAAVIAAITSGQARSVITGWYEDDYRFIDWRVRRVPALDELAAKQDYPTVLEGCDHPEAFNAAGYKDATIAEDVKGNAR